MLPVLWSVNLIGAFAITALVGSTTVPVSVLETVWPCRQRHDAINAQSARTVLDFMEPSPPDERDSVNNQPRIVTAGTISPPVEGVKRPSVKGCGTMPSAFR